MSNLSSKNLPGGAAEANSGGGFVDSKHWAAPLLRRRGAGLGLKGLTRTRHGESWLQRKAPAPGRPGRCGAWHAERAEHEGEGQRRGGVVLVGGGGAGRTGQSDVGRRMRPEHCGLAGWGGPGGPGPGLHKAKRHSSAAGRTSSSRCLSILVSSRSGQGAIWAAALSSSHGHCCRNFAIAQNLLR